MQQYLLQTSKLSLTKARLRKNQARRRLFPSNRVIAYAKTLTVDLLQKSLRNLSEKRIVFQVHPEKYRRTTTKLKKRATAHVNMLQTEHLCSGIIAVTNICFASMRLNLCASSSYTGSRCMFTWAAHTQHRIRRVSDWRFPVHRV